MELENISALRVKRGGKGERVGGGREGWRGRGKIEGKRNSQKDRQRETQKKLVNINEKRPALSGRAHFLSSV